MKVAILMPGNTDQTFYSVGECVDAVGMSRAMSAQLGLKVYLTNNDRKENLSDYDLVLYHCPRPISNMPRKRGMVTACYYQCIQGRTEKEIKREAKAIRKSFDVVITPIQRAAYEFGFEFVPLGPFYSIPPLPDDDKKCQYDFFFCGNYKNRPPEFYDKWFGIILRAKLSLGIFGTRAWAKTKWARFYGGPLVDDFAYAQEFYRARAFLGLGSEIHDRWWMVTNRLYDMIGTGKPVFTDLTRDTLDDLALFSNLYFLDYYSGSNLRDQVCSPLPPYPSRLKTYSKIHGKYGFLSRSVEILNACLTCKGVSLV